MGLNELVVAGTSAGQEPERWLVYDQMRYARCSS
jgi:hypothetical protein